MTDNLIVIGSLLISFTLVLWSIRLERKFQKVLDVLKELRP